MNIDAAGPRVEIGSTWYAARVRAALQHRGQAPAARPCLRRAGCLAVEFRTHVMNQASRRAIERPRRAPRRHPAPSPAPRGRLPTRHLRLQHRRAGLADRARPPHLAAREAARGDCSSEVDAGSREDCSNAARPAAPPAARSDADTSPRRDRPAGAGRSRRRSNRTSAAWEGPFVRRFHDVDRSPRANVPR